MTEKIVYAQEELDRRAVVREAILKMMRSRGERELAGLDIDEPGLERDDELLAAWTAPAYTAR